MKFSVFKSSRDVNFSNALVVDADDHFKELIEGYCEGLGFESVDKYNDFQSAWLKMQDSDYDLIVIDWSTKGALCSAAFLTD